MEVLGLLALLGLGGAYWLLRQGEKSTWVQVDRASGRRLEALYSRLVHLQNHGVNCRLKTGFTVWTTQASLQVHRDEREQAASLLEDFDGEGVKTETSSPNGAAPERSPEPDNSEGGPPRARGAKEKDEGENGARECPVDPNKRVL